MAAILNLRMPAELSTFEDRYSYGERVRERLRRLHNEKGTDFREGRISRAEWEAFLAEEFDPKNSAVTDAVLGLRAEVKDAARNLADDSAEMLDVDLDTAFEEDSAQLG
jgi:hypothetical protein